MPTSHLQLTGSTRCDGQKFLKYLMARGKEVRPEDLQLIRDKNNPVDPNAVQVWYESEIYVEQLGFVKAEQVPEVARCLDHGGKVKITDCKVCGTADTNFGVFFTVTMQDGYSRQETQARRGPIARDFNDFYAECVLKKKLK